MLHLQSISFSYPDQQLALNRISLRLNKQTILGIAGSSGSGKSTLLNAIYGLIDVSSGNIWFKKEKVTGPASNLVPGHKQMRLAGQFHKLQSSISILDQIKYKLINYKNDFREKKAMELLAMVGLENKKNHLPKQLSGGQQQLVNLCCALAEEPELLLLDEPFNNLDPSSKKSLKKYLLALKKENGMSIILVSHDSTDLLSISDEILVLKEGKKIQQDKPEKIFFDPKNEYVAGLFGEFNKIKLKNKIKFIRPSLIQIKSKKFPNSTEVKIVFTEFQGSLNYYTVVHKIAGKIIVSSSEKINSVKAFIKF